MQTIQRMTFVQTHVYVMDSMYYQSATTIVRTYMCMGNTHWVYVYLYYAFIQDR